jgi:hypothetical protein
MDFSLYFEDYDCLSEQEELKTKKKSKQSFCISLYRGSQERGFWGYCIEEDNRR